MIKRLEANPFWQAYERIADFIFGYTIVFIVRFLLLAFTAVLLITFFLVGFHASGGEVIIDQSSASTLLFAAFGFSFGLELTRELTLYAVRLDAKFGAWLEKKLTPSQEFHDKPHMGG